MSLSRQLLFVGVTLAVSLVLHLYIWHRLIKAPGRFPDHKKKIGAAFIVFAFLAATPFLVWRMLPNTVGRIVVFTAFTWWGIFFYLVVFLPISDVVRWFVKKFHPSYHSPERRLALLKITSASAAGLAAMSAGAGAFIHYRGPRIRTVPIVLPKLAEAFHGYRILQLSDIHMGAMMRRDFLEKLVADSMEQKPDLIVVTGDLVDGRVSYMQDLVAPMANLRARDGVYFVTGNHEYFFGAEEWVDYLPILGLKVLQNQHVTIARGNHGLTLAGVPDLIAEKYVSSHRPDIERALSGRNPAWPVVLLAHQPKAIKAAQKAGVDLQLSGHTHGGQLFPMNLLVEMRQPTVNGYGRLGNTQLFVSNGCGSWGPPMRVGATAEIVTLQLQSPDLT